MVCRACGSETVDGNGICAVCGARNTPARIAVTDLVAPEPTPVPAYRGAHPQDDTDPSATNPSSGFFCGRCGSAVDPKSDYCGICGNPLNEVALQRARITLRNSAPLADLATAFDPGSRSSRDDAADDPNDTAPRHGKLSGRTALLVCVIGGAVVIGLAIMAMIVMRFHP